ncbi:DUF3450 family protein [Aliiglaciecola lipolytica]|nr:DUF3450 family protein [Aliiglaciecola lipolytica]
MISSCLLFSCLAKAVPTDLDKLVNRWVQLEQQISTLNANWRERKPLLEQQLQLLKAENKTLSAMMQDDTTHNDEIDERRLALLSQQTELEKTQNRLSSQLEKVQQLLIGIYPQLPPPLQQQWETELLVLDSLSENGERLEKQLYLLDSMQKYNQRIVTHQTSMTFENHMEVQVEQVFLGTSRGWYVSLDGRFWGSGHSSPSGWVWQAQPTSVNADALLDFVTAIKNVNQAKLVSLPIVLGSKQYEN